MFRVVWVTIYCKRIAYSLPITGTLAGEEGVTQLDKQLQANKQAITIIRAVGPSSGHGIDAKLVSIWIVVIIPT